MDKEWEKGCCCALGKIFGSQPKVALTLMEHLGSAGAVFELDNASLDEILGPFSKYRGALTKNTVEASLIEIERLNKSGADYIGINDSAYPEDLKECDDPPTGLYFCGCSPAAEVLRRNPMVAVVGTRDISPYGTQWCRKIVADGLGQCREKPTVVSGLAYGTDITAHLSALDVGLPTIAVMATGIDSIYPLRHRGAARRIVETTGCALITDYPPGTQPLAYNFLRRNRIIAGMSRATILVESKIKGGGMMTASLAFNYGREVYALPGRADDLRSQGCNRLIRMKMAEAVTDCPELVKSLGFKRKGRTASMDTENFIRDCHGGSNPEEAADLVLVFKKVRCNRGISLDELARECNMPYKTACRMAYTLEEDGLIEIDLLQRCTAK